jgi:hypothetical protein
VKPRVPATQRASGKPPVCSSCHSTFLAVFTNVNDKVAEPDRLSDDQLEAKAAKRAQAVRFGSEWACPRCTRLEDTDGKELMLKQAYPSRQTRRDVVRATRKKGRPSKAPTRAKLTPPTRAERAQKGM